MILSETYTLWDCLWYGVDITDWSLQSQVSYSLVNNLHTWTVQSSSTGTYTATETDVLTGDFRVEITGLNVPSNYTVRVAVIEVASPYSLNNYGIYDVENATFVIERVDGVFTGKLNGNPVSAQSGSSNFSTNCKVQLRFYIGSTNVNIPKTISFKDIKVYQI